jgi:hypothetical protein
MPSATPAIAVCIRPMPTNSSPKPATGRPAAATRSRPTSRISAPRATATRAMAEMSSFSPK